MKRLKGNVKPRKLFLYFELGSVEGLMNKKKNVFKNFQSLLITNWKGNTRTEI